MAKQLHSERTEKSPLANVMPAAFAGIGKKRIDIFVHAQNTPAPAGRGWKPQPRAVGVGIGPLVFRCPATGHDIESGIEMDWLTFRRIGHLSVRLRCQSCGLPHEHNLTEGCLASYRMPPGVGDLCRPDVCVGEYTMH
jgi:hypothetical protein